MALLALLLLAASLHAATSHVMSPEGKDLGGVFPHGDPRERVWDFVQGTYRLVNRSNILETWMDHDHLGEDHHLLPSVNDSALVREKRQFRRAPVSFISNNKHMEMAIYVDQYLWDLYVKRYGVGQARQRLQDYVKVVLSSTQAVYLHPSFQPTLKLSMDDFVIWTRQPAALTGNAWNAFDYLDAFCSFVKPHSSGFDHATLITGYELIAPPGVEIDGIAFQNGVCTDISCTVVRGTSPPYRLGNTLAHEMGHSLGMIHDGTGEARSCDATCCVMAPQKTGTRWSRCSMRQYHTMLAQLGPNGCLNSPFGRGVPIQDPLGGLVSEFPGQIYPDEAQCHQIMGTCFRHLPGKQSDCKQEFCTANLEGSVVTRIGHIRLDGTYCGPGKVCKSGECIRLNRIQGRALTPVSGGWSEWRSDAEDACGGGDCSSCSLSEQVSMRIEVRRCDQPYPKNGGRPCTGSQIRGVICHRDIPTNCRPGLRSSGITKIRFAKSYCKINYHPFADVYIKKDNGCFFACGNPLNDSENPKPFNFPTGTRCGSVLGSGRCVRGVCMHPRCRIREFYVATGLDCPEL